MSETWFEETLHRGFRMRLKATRVLFDRRTDHQHLVIFDNPDFGRMMMLDGVVQLATRDEFIYHEMMAHLPLFAQGAPRRVLIVGGGDGGVLREVLRHRSVEGVTLCEIDRSVVDLCAEHFPDIAAGAFDDPRTNLVIGDGVRLVAETQERFDVILIDSTDPIGPAEMLFTTEFYSSCKRCLESGGVMATQSGVPFAQGPDLRRGIDRLRAVFADAWAFHATTPSYFGGPLAYGWASDEPALRALPLDELARRYDASGIATRYYRPDVHLGALALPGYIRELVERR